MMLAIEVTVVPDDPHTPTTTNTAKVNVHPDTLKRYSEGEYPMTLQIFVEAAIPRLIRDTIKEALPMQEEVPTR